MASLIEQATLQTANISRQVTEDMDEITIEIENASRCQQRSWTTEELYSLSLTVRCNFWANNVSMDSQRSLAEKQLLELIYSDVARQLNRLKLCVGNSNKKEAFRVIKDIEDSIGLS